jgi:indolepyruvate ferredoxin oxidoreductase alpha subunit
MSSKAILLGNGAIAHGLVEGGVQVVTSYPGTPSSEILPEVVRLKKEHNLNIHAEWSVNEKVAFDVALGASYAGKRAAVVMKQVGLNVAADSLMSSAYTGVIGGFVIISCDDPGPHSSQTEQDTRFFAMFAKVPALDPSDPQEAKELVKKAFELSEKYEIPVVLRPSIRVCHAKQAVGIGAPLKLNRPAAFRKDPSRWAATPKYRLQLHEELNRKLERIREEFETTDYADFTDWIHRVDSTGTTDGKRAVRATPKGKRFGLGILAGGVPFAHAVDLLAEYDLAEGIPLMKVTTAFPLPLRRVSEFMKRCRHVLVLEEPEDVIELQIVEKSKLLGRFNGLVPGAGELTPEVVHSILRKAMRASGSKRRIPAREGKVDEIVKEMKLSGRRPTLCAGCPHRAAFFAIKKAFSDVARDAVSPEAAEDPPPAARRNGLSPDTLEPIFTSDIGCYTLGLNLDGVDTCLDMGAGVTLANGFYQAFAQDGRTLPIIATVGDSTFFHACVPPLLNAVYNKAGFVLVILDNSITAMTGMQPTPGLGITADGSEGRKVPIEQVVAGCGVEFVRVCDPYNVDEMVSLLKEAHAHALGTRNLELRTPNSSSPAASACVAVVIARHPCIIKYKDAAMRARKSVAVDDRLCKSCKVCVKSFECPALVFVPEKKKVEIEQRLCVGCGVCVHACKAGAIVAGSL